MKNHVDFAALKNSLLEEELKIQEFPENRNQLNVPFENKKMTTTTLIANKKEQETSKKSFESRHPEEPYHNEESSIDDLDTNSSEEDEEEKEACPKEECLEKVEEEKNEKWINNNLNPKQTKLNKIIDKVKESYNLFKNDNFSFCNNMNQLINDINSEVFFDENSLNNKSKKILTNEKKNTYIKEKESVPFEQVLQNKVKNSKQLIVLKNFYNEVRSTVNDFVDVYLEKDSLNNNDIHTNLYNNIKKQNINNENCMKEPVGRELKENREEEKSFRYKTQEIIKREDAHSHFEKPLDANKKGLYDFNENILHIDCKLKDIKSINEYDQLVTKGTQENIKKPQKNIYIKKRTNYKENSRAIEKEKNILQEENLTYEELLAGALSSFQTNNEIQNQDEDLYNINKENKFDSSHYFNNDSSIEKAKTYNRKIEKSQNIDERRLQNYLMSKNNNKMDYADMITSYIKKKNPNENKKNKHINHVKKGSMMNNPNGRIRNEKLNDHIVDTQVNDSSIFDISQMTQKYKYQSNIMFTINKVKNLEPIIEVNISISDIQLRIPGFRVENVILPYKVSNDVLVVQIKTLAKKKKGRHITTSGESEKSEPGIENQGKDIMENFLFKYQLKEEKSKEIKYYYLFIPLNHINEEIINKRLLLITPKYRRIFEKENLLPVTIYLIQSKELTSSSEKHLYISIKKCINGIHYYPFSDVSKELEHLSENEKDKIKKKPFTPVYVSLYNDEMDRAIGNTMNDNHLVGKVQVYKLKQKRRYLINKKEYEIFYNEEHKLMCKHIQDASNHEFTPMPLIHLFHILCNHFVITKSPLDLFPLYVFPPIKDITYFEFIEKNEFLQLQFLLHFLAIMEQISFYLCRMLQLPVMNQKSHESLQNEPKVDKPFPPLLFSNHIQPIVLHDQNGKEHYYTFLYSSYNQINENNEYPFNYIKPIIYKIDVHEEKENGENSKESSQEEQFIYSYANQHSIYLFNHIRNYEEIKSISSCYDPHHSLFFTTDESRKQFQEFYLTILDRYQQLMELQWTDKKDNHSNTIKPKEIQENQYNTKKNKQYEDKKQVGNSYHENSDISIDQTTNQNTQPCDETKSVYTSDYLKQSIYNRNKYHKNTSFQDYADEKMKKNELSSSEKIFLTEQNQFNTCDFAQVFEDYQLEEQDNMLSNVANKSELDMIERLTNTEKE